MRMEEGASILNPESSILKEWRYRLGAQDTALSRLEHGFESR